MKYPKKHISIRVPWHDSGWDGRVCVNPRLNGACLKLKRIGQERNDIAEEAVAGQSLGDLPQDKWPCCVAERVAFMSPFEYTRVANHPYKHTSEGVTDTSLLPIYAIPPIPLLRSHSLGCCGNRWMDSAKHMVWMCGRSGSQN